MPSSVGLLGPYDPIDCSSGTGLRNAPERNQSSHRVFTGADLPGRPTQFSPLCPPTSREATPGGRGALSMPPC